MKSSTEWVIRDARVTRVAAREKVTYVSLATAGYNAGTTDYWDVTTFSRDGLSFVEGASVTVRGTLSKRKPPEGQRNWTTELIAREVKPGDENLTVAMPARKQGGKSASASHQTAEATDDDNIPF